MLTPAQSLVLGVNVNETNFPKNIPNAVSLKELTGPSHDIMSIAKHIHQEVMKMIDHADPDWKAVYDKYIFQKGMTQKFKKNGDIMEAIIEGVDEQGKLVLKKDNDECKAFYTHEIKWMT